jgi:hypothetical protein
VCCDPAPRVDPRPFVMAQRPALVRPRRPPCALPRWRGKLTGHVPTFSFGPAPAGLFLASSLTWTFVTILVHAQAGRSGASDIYRVDPRHSRGRPPRPTPSTYRGIRRRMPRRRPDDGQAAGVGCALAGCEFPDVDWLAATAGGSSR